MPRLKNCLFTVFLLTATMVSEAPVLASTGSTIDQATIDQALKAYDAGDFATALSGFESLLATGAINGHVYYNMGNTYYRLGRVGDAMAAYLAARRYLPRDPDVTANIRFVLKGTTDRLETKINDGVSQVLLFWIRSFTAKELALATTFLTWLATIFIGISIKYRRLRPTAFALLSLPLLTLIAYFLHRRHDQAWGAITAETAQVRSGPGAKDAVIFELHSGAPFAVIGSRGATIFQIQLSDGKKGWVAMRDARVFGEL